MHLKWTQRISEEFFLQGDKEKQMNLDISPFMDRNNSDLPKSQFGFINFLVVPLYSSFTEQFKELQPCLDQLLANRDYWEAKNKTTKEEK